MKISVYKTPSMCEWYPSLLHRVLLELGHDSQLIDPSSDVAVDDDITFFCVWNTPLEPEKLKGKTKCVVLVETEQVHLGYKELSCQHQQKADVVVFPGWFPVGGLYRDELCRSGDKLIVEMPLGYHPSLCHTAVPLPHKDLLLLEYCNSSWRKPYFDAIEKAGFSMYFESFDLQEIANWVASVDICLTTHQFGPSSFLSAFRVVGLFLHNQGFVMSQRASTTFLEEDKHIVYFEGVDEMMDKCRYYISHPEEARRIALEAFNHLKTLPMTEIVKFAISEICRR